MADKWVKRAGTVLAGGIFGVYSDKAGIWIGIMLLLICLRLLLWKPDDFFGQFRRPELWLLIAGFAVSFLLGLTAEKTLSVPVSMDHVMAEGVLKDWKVDKSSAHGIIRISNYSEKDGYRSGGKYVLAVYPDKEGFLSGWSKVRPGDRIRVYGRLEQPKDPGVEGGFNAPVYNAVRGISGTFTASGDVTIVKKGNPPVNWLLKDKFNQILTSCWPEQAALMNGILFGDTFGIDKDLVEAFKVNGVLHVFAASGSNIAFVLILAWTLFFFLPDKVRITACLVCVWFYTLLCGLNPPILRAAILASAVLTGRIFSRNISGIRWLMFAGVILFIINPLYVQDISFQLSFTASLGIIVLTPILTAMKPFASMQSGLKTLLCLGLSAQIMAMPILLTVFHRVSLLGLLSNILVVFLLAAVLQLGLIGMLFLSISGLAKTFLTVAFWLLDFAQNVLLRLAGLPIADFWVLEPGIVFWLIWYIVIFYFISNRDKTVFIGNVCLKRARIKNYLTKKQLNIYLCALLLLILVLPLQNKKDLKITFLDVGQGDCILLQTSRENLLVDTGPKTENYDAGEKIVLPYLLHKNIGKLDLVLVTHPDNDHLGGSEYLLNNIPADKVGLPQISDEDEEKEWRQGIPEMFWRENKVIRMGAGDEIRYKSGLILHFLAPVSGYSSTNKGTVTFNDRSLVLLAEYCGRKVLLTGYMAEAETQDIEDRGESWEADFLKLPHHGSKGSLIPEFYDAVSPQGVVISVGRNRYGHPSAEVLSYWQERGVPVYRTDEDGTVTLVLGRNGITLSTERN
jgi:competence protein ComEC